MGEEIKEVCMMKQKGYVHLSGLSINQAFQGRRFLTKEAKAWREEALWLLKMLKIPMIAGWVEVSYIFTLKGGYKTKDVANLEKEFTDALVDANILDDDRFIRKMTLEKVQGEIDKIEFEIIKLN